MAGMFGKIQGGISGTLGKAKNLRSGFTGDAGNEMSIGRAKNEKKSLLQDKQKYLCYLGMAVYGLYREGKLENEELESDLTKLLEIDNRLDELDQIVEELEKMKRAKNICECGAKLSKNDQFCPNCGRKVKEVILCRCGAELSPDTKFCNHCGADVSKLLHQENEAEEEKTCLCGAKIMAGQIMCMECGRMVE